MLTDLVKVALLLVQSESSSIGSFQFYHQVFNFYLQTLFGFLQRGTFGLRRLLGLLHRLQMDH